MPFCSACGAEYQLGHDYCLKCGARLPKETSEIEPSVPKAVSNPNMRRFIAGLIDVGVILAIICALFLSRRFVIAILIKRRIAWLVPSAYLLLKDSIGGKSIGKLFTGILVFNEKEKKSAGLLDSILRNWPLAIPVVGWLLVLVVGASILMGKQKRLGDRGSNTIVISDTDYQRIR